MIKTGLSSDRMLCILTILVLLISLSACNSKMNHDDSSHSGHMDHEEMVSQVETGVDVTHEDLLIKDIWGRPSIEGENSAAFMILMNKGEEDERLIGVEGEIASAVEIHKSKIENDIMSMQQVDYINIPADGQAQLKSGGYHIMFIRLTKDLKEGDTYPLTLYFEKSGKVEVEVQVHQP